MTTAIYPGTFDPVTNGHLDVMERAGHIFDKVIVAVAENLEKGPMFDVEERLQFIRENAPGNGQYEFTSYSCLLVDFAQQVNAQAIVRGLRAVSDFEYEFQMTLMNRHLDDGMETIFLMPSQDFFFTSSSLIKQVARYNGDISYLVPKSVAAALAKKFGR